MTRAGGLDRIERALVWLPRWMWMFCGSLLDSEGVLEKINQRIYSWRAFSNGAILLEQIWNLLFSEPLTTGNLLENVVFTGSSWSVLY